MTPTTAATMKAVEITGPRDVRIVDPSTAPISTEMLVTVTTAKSVEAPGSAREQAARSQHLDGSGIRWSGYLYGAGE